MKGRKQVGLDGEWIVGELDYKFHDKLSAFDKLVKHLGLASEGEAIRQLLALVGQSPPSKPTENQVDKLVDLNDGPTGYETAEDDRPSDYPIPTNG